MNKTNLTTIFADNSLPTGNLRVYYDFNLTGVNDRVVINELYDADDHFINDDPAKIKTGTIPGLSCGCTSNPTASQSYSSGFFNETDLVKVGNGFPEDSWTCFLDFKKSEISASNRSSVLITSMDDHDTPSGFNLCVNEGNRLSLEFIKNGIEKVVYTYDQEIGEQNFISISKTDNEIDIINHDFPNRSNNYQSFNVSGIAPSSDWAVGDLPNNSSVNYTGFKGYIDNFILYAGGLQNAERINVANRFVHTGTQLPVGSTETILYNKITGVVVNQFDVTGSGITGFTSVMHKTIDCDCDSSTLTLYSESGVSGDLYGEKIQYLTGNIIKTDTFLITDAGGKALYDYEIVNRYAEENILFNKDVDPAAFYEVYSYLEFNDNVNRKGEWEGTQVYLTGFNSGTDIINVYVNGSGIYSGTGLAEGEVGYSFLNDSHLIFNDLNGVSSAFSSVAGDEITFNKVSEHSALSGFTGYVGPRTISLTGAQFLNKDIYHKGRKLLSGLHWDGFPTEIKIYASDFTSGDFLFFGRSTETFNRHTGINGQQIQCPFTLLDEQVWLSGIKLENNTSYIKISDLSLLNNNSYINNYSNLIYNNQGNFMNS
jgi:hypothetical protein